MFRYIFILLFLVIGCTDSTPGSLDTTLGDNGKVTTNFSGTNDEIKALAVASDGKIVAVGRTSNGNNDDFALARYSSSGQLDTSFGTAGLVTTNIFNQDDVAYSVKIQSDGKIIVGGSAGTPAGTVFALARYTTEGALDASFGVGGIVTTSIGTVFDEVRSLGIQTNGSIVAAGFSKNNVFYRVAVARYTTSGALDTTFNNTGKLVWAIGPQDSQIYDLIIEPSGLLTMAGTTVTTDRDFLLLRLLPSGLIDTSFNGTGFFTKGIASNANDTAYSIRKSSEGKYVVSGTSSGDENAMAAIKVSSAGILDSTFGTQGIFTGKANANNTLGKAMHLTSNGKILLGGTELGNTFNFALIRATLNGVLDYSFGTKGAFTIDFNNNLDELNAIAQQADGKIIVGGRTYNGSNFDFALARLNN